MSRDKRVTVLFNKEEFDEAEREATKIGLSKSGYVRLMYMYAREYIKSVTPMGVKNEDSQELEKGA